MNLNQIHAVIIVENEILKLQNKLIKTDDEKKKDELKAEIIRLNGKINMNEVGRMK